MVGTDGVGADTRLRLVGPYDAGPRWDEAQTLGTAGQDQTLTSGEPCETLSHGPAQWGWRLAAK
jgi:hypothetical protein